jgi:hypothetical protein
MRLITDTVPSALAGTAQAVYGLVGVGGATAVLIILSGWLYTRYPFRTGRLLGNGSAVHRCFSCHLDVASRTFASRACRQIGSAFLI